MRGFVRRIDHLVVHHSASPLSTTLEDIRRWHVSERGFTDTGYHWVIEKDGTIRPGRSVYLMGAHAKGHNQNTLGVCLVGNNTESGQRWTRSQVAQLRKLWAACVLIFPDITILGHRDLPGARTECPGRDIKEMNL